jgi:UDP-N-acetylmuramoyl-L-alanyl-D-glutamate--2,6-diaminopimelate ligase
MLELRRKKMKVKELLKEIDYRLLQGDLDKEVESIAYDSRQVKEKGLFVCIEGYVSDGHKFIPDAIAKGAGSLLVSKKVENLPSDITVIQVEDTRKALASVAAAFYGYPANQIKLIGVTGTNGKTTTAYLIGRILEEYNNKVAVLGTIENRIGNKVLKTERTTPESLDLQALFSEMLKEEVSHCVMEVSSHALELSRVAGCYFEIGIFTNLSLDHLDFHKTMENYKMAKAKLFKNCKYGIINMDDASASDIIKASSCEIITFAIEKEADFRAYDIHISSKGIEFTVKIDHEEVRFKLNTIGRFNVYNALGAIVAAYYLNIPKEVIKTALEKMEGVPGRVQNVSSHSDFNILVDYAHTPDGLENVLKTIKEFAKGEIITVFGCGGDRDKSKRPIMGKIAGEYSSYCIITSDNPRTEDPEKIIDEIEAGIKESNCPYEKIVDRREAIKKAVQRAKKDDVILIAGKGHENYQILKDKVVHFDDAEEVRAILQEDYNGSHKN